jgi:hypothetical protein
MVYTMEVYTFQSRGDRSVFHFSSTSACLVNRRHFLIFFIKSNFTNNITIHELKILHRSKAER